MERGGSWGLTKSLKEGPLFSLSEKVLAGRGGVVVLVGGGGSLIAVANGRRRRHDGCTGRRAGSACDSSLRQVGLRDAIGCEI